MYNIINASGNSAYAQSIYSIDTKCFPNDSWSAELISAELQQNRTVYFICIAEGQTVGYLNASIVLDEVELNRIAVIDECRRRGLADNMMIKLIDYSRMNNCSVIHLEVRSQNHTAISLYKKHLFEFDTLRKGYYQNPSDDAVLMSRKL